MYGFNDLKAVRSKIPGTVVCPVRGCATVVPQQARPFRATPDYFCSIHRVFISPSTFEYEDYLDNLLWRDAEDVALLNAVLRAKRESRLARERSEDAVSWNVFRFLERSGALPELLQNTLGLRTNQAKVFYWSYCADVQGAWPQLAAARRTFGEGQNRGSEPDIIIVCDEDIVFVEAKLTSRNVTVPSEPENPKLYTTGGDNWFSTVFQQSSTFHKMACEDRLYELMRLWLIGTYVSMRDHKRFHLMNLVCERYEADIQNRCNAHLTQAAGRTFHRVTWENIHRNVTRMVQKRDDMAVFDNYMKQKTIGYNSRGRLLLAFNIYATMS